MLQAVHDHLEGRLREAEFQATVDDAVRLCMLAQGRAGADVLTDGEQRRDSCASFVGRLLDNCQSIPLSDLTAMVDDPEELEMELRDLDVPAAEVRHPVVCGKLGRSSSLALQELEFAKSSTGKAIKVALLGPYPLTRTMWLDCLTDRPYDTREDLAQDVVRALREDLHYLLAPETGHDGLRESSPRRKPPDCCRGWHSSSGPCRRRDWRALPVSAPPDS